MKKKSMALIAALVVAVGGFAAVATTGCSPKEQNGANTEETLNTPEPEALSKDLYETAIAELPMISAQVDTFALFKAKDEDSKEALKDALVAYQGALESDTFQYPANLLKIQASTIYMKGDYVCFLMLGTLDNETMMQEDESKVIEAYRAENDKAIAAMDELF